MKRENKSGNSSASPVFQGRKVPLGYYLVQTSKAKTHRNHRIKEEKQRLPVKVTQQNSHTTL